MLHRDWLLQIMPLWGLVVALGIELQLFSIPQQLFQFKNVMPTLEVNTQKRLGTVKPRFYIVEMFQIMLH